jgi:hypothetical protein
VSSAGIRIIVAMALSEVLRVSAGVEGLSTRKYNRCQG